MRLMPSSFEIASSVRKELKETVKVFFKQLSRDVLTKTFAMRRLLHYYCNIFCGESTEQRNSRYFLGPSNEERKKHFLAGPIKISVIAARFLSGPSNELRNICYFFQGPGTSSEIIVTVIVTGFSKEQRNNCYFLGTRND